MSNLVCRIWPLLLLGGFVLPGVRHVSGIVISTEKEVEVVNGTNVKLKCTFISNKRVTATSVIVSWNFRPLNLGAEESVFHYQDVPYPPEQGRFKGHVVWSGDVLRNDASITLHEVPPTFNGTYTCQVRNSPDVHGRNGEITLRVVDKSSHSQIAILAIAVGVACGVILILLSIVVAVRFYRRQRMESDIEMPERDDPTVCQPEEAVHLIALTPKKEVESSDDEGSEPSSGDDDEEEDGEEEDDDDDDDDDDDGGGDDDDD